MIIGFLGLPGMGKTLSMVHLACKELKANRKVISNVRITDTIFGSKNEANYTQDIGSAIRNAENCTICIDEAPIVLPNYYWQNMPIDLLIRFAQVRKYHLNIYYTTQGFNHTVKRLRDLTNYFVLCTHRRGYFKNEYLDPEYYSMKVPKKYKSDYKVKSEYIFFWSFRKTYNAFNTLDLVNTSIAPIDANNVKNVLLPSL